MSWKIKKIVIENFKFFHESFSLDVDSKNLLIYGENGSGKSSIYWALYTLFQSRLKTTNADVEKYFDASNDENLRNKYSAVNDASKVEVTFEDKDDPSTEDKTYTIAPGNITTRRTPDTFLDFTLSSSDFLNYKMLYKLTDKENSVVNDVTDMFIKEIYPFAEFQIGYTDLNGTATGIRNAMQWHDYILRSIDQLEHQQGRRHRQFDAHGPKYQLYKRLIREFRDQLALYLAEINLRATNILSDKFKIKDVVVKLETDAEYVFDKPTSPRYRDYQLHQLHIYLNAKYKNEQLAGGECDILHPRTFFNEAKLTCIGLAIRLAVVESKIAGGTNYASVLCLDDLLVSLDMSYRVPVIETLLGYAGNYQLCVFTHDRSLYHMIWGAIRELDNNKEDWKKLEFYRSDLATEATEEPKVNCIEPTEGKEKVKAYFAQGDYSAAGNYLRKYAEELIKGILPLNLTYDVSEKGEIIALMLRGLYERTVSKKSEGFCALYDISSSLMPNIAKYLDRLMNPLSHDNKTVPIFRQELEDALVEVLKYEPIRDSKKVIVKREDAGKRFFRIEMTKDGVTKSVDFVPIEQWDYFTLPSFSSRKYKDCEVLIKAMSGCYFTLKSKMKIKSLYRALRKQSQLREIEAPAFDQSIKEIATGTLLGAM